MRWKDVKLGDKWYGGVQTYSGPFPKGHKVVEFEITKINKKSFMIKFGSKRNPTVQRVPKVDKEYAYYKTKLEVWKKILEGAKRSKDDYYNKIFVKQAIRNIKQLSKPNIPQKQEINKIRTIPTNEKNLLKMMKKYV